MAPLRLSFRAPFVQETELYPALRTTQRCVERVLYTSVYGQQASDLDGSICQQGAKIQCPRWCATMYIARLYDPTSKFQYFTHHKTYQ